MLAKITVCELGDPSLPILDKAKLCFLETLPQALPDAPFPGFGGLVTHGAAFL